MQRLKKPKDFSFFEVPALNLEHLVLLQELRRKTISVMRRAYPTAYVSDNDSYRYAAQTRPELKIPIEELEEQLSAIYTDERVEHLAGLEAQLSPKLEEYGFNNVLRFIRPSVMDAGPTSDKIRISVQGRCRCMEHFRMHPDSEDSLDSFFKLRKNKKPIHLDTVSVEELVEDWQEILLTDTRLAENPELNRAITPPCPFYSRPHEDIVLSTVFVFEYVNRGQRVRGSSPLHSRKKGGSEFARKMTLWLIGAYDSFTDCMGSRSLAYDDASFLRIMARTIRDYPFSGFQDGSTYAANYTHQDFSYLLSKAKVLAEEGILEKGELGILRPIISKIRGDAKKAVVSENGQKRGAKDIEWMARLAGSPEDEFGYSNVHKHMFYTDSEFTRLNGEGGQDDFEYALRREKAAMDSYTVGHWIVYHNIGKIMFDPQSRRYMSEVLKARLEEAKRIERALSF